MTRLVLLAHGSHDPVWRETFERLLGRMVVELGHERVRLAYMQFAKPTLYDVAGEASLEGIETLKLLPLFLSAGGHVRHDIPPLVEHARLRNSELRIEVLTPVGEREGFGNLVASLARETMS